MIKDYQKQMKEVVAPSPGVLDSYKKLYRRNQTKWMRRSKLELQHLDKEVEIEGVTYVLEGSIDSSMMIIRDKETGKFYMVYSDLMDHSFGVGEKKKEDIEEEEDGI
jgi:hypothetical protein